MSLSRGGDHFRDGIIGKSVQAGRYLWEAMNHDLPFSRTVGLAFRSSILALTRP